MPDKVGGSRQCQKDDGDDNWCEYRFKGMINTVQRGFRKLLVLRVNIIGPLLEMARACVTRLIVRKFRGEECRVGQGFVIRPLF